MAFTARLPADLQKEAEQYAATVGLSLNAFLSVALREYLDRRRFVPPPVQVDVPAKSGFAGLRSSGPSALLDSELGESIPREVSRAPCWCGSGRQLRHCHRRPK